MSIINLSIEQRREYSAGVTHSYQRAMAAPLVGVEIATIRHDLEKLRGLINPSLLEFIYNSYNAALAHSGTEPKSEIFGDPDSLEWQGD